MPVKTVQELWLSERAPFLGSYQADVVIPSCYFLHTTTVLSGTRGQNIELRCEIQRSLCFINCLSICCDV